MSEMKIERIGELKKKYKSGGIQSFTYHRDVMECIAEIDRLTSELSTLKAELTLQASHVDMLAKTVIERSDYIVKLESRNALLEEVVLAWSVVAVMAGISVEDFECECDPPSNSDMVIMNLRDAIAKLEG